ncbi:MAG: PPC domain-containing protein [Pleurocapsa minor GSE-CHR-MK-17-07R]|jgi:hypothetical protein|nr:PPC domain-containing protein [Pleurocapsa minor GSE-CHR-MK 17-07R]
MLLFVLISGIQPAQAQSCPGTLRGADCTNYNRAVETFYGLENAAFEFEYRVTTEMGNMSSSTTSIRGSGRFFVNAQGNIDNMFLLLDSASMDMGGFFSGGISSYDGLAEGATNYIIAIVDGRLLLCRGVSGEGSCDSYDASQLRMPLSRLDPNVGFAQVPGISTSWAVSEQSTSDIPAYASFAQSNAPMAEALGMLGGQMGSPGSGDSMMGALLGSMFGSGFDAQMQTQAAYGGLISLNAAENRIQALNQITSASTDISGMVGQDLFSSLVGTTSVVTQANNIGFFSINDPELERETLDNIPYTIRPASGGSIYIAAANNTSIFGLAQAYYLPLLMGGQLNNGVSSASGSSSSSSGSTTVTALSPISALNGSVSATLPSGRTFDYTYQAEAGETVTFLLTSEDFDTFLELFNADGTIITADDDSGGSLDSLITRTFSTSGEYVLRVRSFGNSSGGPFTLTATRAGSAGGTTSSGSSSSGGTTSGSASGSTNPMTLESGARDMGVFEVEAGGTMRSGEQHDYTYLAQGGETVTFYLTSEDFDTYIEVYNESGDFIASDDDSGGSLDSLITITLNDPGAYLVRARAFGSSGSGDYALIATVEDFGSSTSGSTSSGTTSGTTTGAQASGELVSVVSGNLPRGGQQDYIYSAQAGERATFLLASAAFDTFLELYGPSGLLLSSDDDSGGNLDSRITHTFGGAGEYVLRVRSFNNNSGGAFTLTVEGTTVGTAPSSSGSSTTASAAGTLAGQLTDVINGTLPDGDTLDYGYTAAAGETATFLLAAPQFDTFLELLDASGDIIESDDDSGGSLDSMLTYTFRQAGDYVLRVRSFGNSDGGAFTLSLESTTSANQAAPTAAPTAVSGSVSSGLLPVRGGALGGTRNGMLIAGNVIDYVYNAEAGEVVTIALTSSAFAPRYEIFSPDGTLRNTSTVSDGTVSSTLTLDQAGTWTIRVSDASGTGSGAFTVSLNQQTPEEVEAALDTREVVSGDTIVYGEQVTGTLEGAPILLTFSGTSGDEVFMALTSSDFDTYLILRDDRGTLIAENDDYDGTNSQIVYTLSKSGTYQIEVRGYYESAEGTFFLNFGG